MDEYVITNPVQRTIWAYKPGWESLGAPWIRFEPIGMTRRIRSGGTSPRDRHGRLILRANAFSSDVWREDHSLSSVETRFLTGSSGWRNVILSDPSPVRDRAIAKWYEAVADHRMDLMVTMAERTKTAEMLGLAAMRVSGALRAVKKGMLFEAFKELKRGQQILREQVVHSGHSKSLGRHYVTTPASVVPGKTYASPENLWLEYSYGWVPFYNDVFGAMTASVDNFLSPSKVVTRRARQSGSFQNRSDTSREWITTTRGSVVASATVSATVSMVNDLHHRMNTLGLVNPASVAWELVPYSFCIDWFLPVGDWIAAQSALAGLSVSDASTTTTTRWLYSQETIPNSHEFLAGTTPHKGSGARTLKVRSLGLPKYPSLTFRVPDGISWAISALALARQRFDGSDPSKTNRGFGQKPIHIDPTWGDPTAIQRRLAERRQGRLRDAINSVRPVHGSLGP